MKQFVVLLMSLLAFSVSPASSKLLKTIPRSSDLELEVKKILPSKVKDWEEFVDALESTKYVLKNNKITIESKEIDEDTGDLGRVDVFVVRGAKKEKLPNSPMAWVYVTKDEKYIISEPLSVIEVSKWKTQDLGLKLNAEGSYFQVLRYSPSTQSLIIAQFGCLVDCPKEDKYSLWEIDLK